MSFPVNTPVTTDYLKLWGVANQQRTASFDLQRQRLEDATLLAQVKEEIARLQRIQHFVESKYVYPSLFLPGQTFANNNNNNDTNDQQVVVSASNSPTAEYSGGDTSARKLPSVVNLLNSSTPATGSGGTAGSPPQQAQAPLTVLYELLQQQQFQEQQQALSELAFRNIGALDGSNHNFINSNDKQQPQQQQQQQQQRNVPLFAIPEAQSLLASHSHTVHLTHSAPKGRREEDASQQRAAKPIDTATIYSNNGVKREKSSDLVRYHKQGRGKLPEKATEILSRWLFEHANAPYPTPYEKEKLMEDTRLSLIQINNWFVNARRRLLPGLVKNDPEKILSRTVYVNNVDEKITPLELIGFFNACCGPILKSKAIDDQSERVFVFEFGCSQSASKAVRLSGTFLGNFPIKVTIADGKYELLSRPDENKDEVSGETPISSGEEEDDEEETKAEAESSPKKKAKISKT